MAWIDLVLTGRLEIGRPFELNTARNVVVLPSASGLAVVFVPTSGFLRSRSSTDALAASGRGFGDTTLFVCLIGIAMIVIDVIVLRPQADKFP